MHSLWFWNSGQVWCRLLVRLVVDDPDNNESSQTSLFIQQCGQNRIRCRWCDIAAILETIWGVQVLNFLPVWRCISVDRWREKLRALPTSIKGDEIFKRYRIESNRLLKWQLHILDLSFSFYPSRRPDKSCDVWWCHLKFSSNMLQFWPIHLFKCILLSWYRFKIHHSSKWFLIISLQRRLDSLIRCRQHPKPEVFSTNKLLLALYTWPIWLCDRIVSRDCIRWDDSELEISRH